MKDLTAVAEKEQLEGNHPPGEPARQLHDRRQDLLRSGQHPFLAVAVAVQRRVSKALASLCRRTGTNSSQLLRRLKPRPYHSARRRWSALAVRWCLRRVDGRHRRQGHLPQGLQGQERRGCRCRSARSPRSSRPPTMRARCPRAPMCRTGTRLPTWSSPARPAVRSWVTGRRANLQVAGQVAGKDYTCLPGLGVNEIISTGGDAFYFPVVEDEEEKSAAQDVLASTLLAPETQVAFNLKKGSLPVRGDVDLACGQRLHEEGPRHPRQGQHPARGH